MLPFMEKFQLYSCLVLLRIILIIQVQEVLSLSVSSFDNIKLLIYYFNKYPLLGVIYNDYKNGEVIYNMIISKRTSYW